MVDPVAIARERDLELAGRAASGERAAQRQVFLEQRAHVHRALYRILGSNREIEDLAQDAFVEIFRSLGSFRGNSSLGRWCQTIAVRIAYVTISRRRPPTVDLALVDDGLANDVDVRRTVQMREVARRLYAALDRIEPKQRIAFALAAIDGRPMAEVAQLTGSTMFAIKTRIWRARRELMRHAARDAVLSAYLQELSGGES